MRASYSTEVEGGRPVRLRYVVEGRMRVGDYLAFVAERAHWFGLDGWIEPNGAESVTLVVSGPEAMVGALEMACTLGPLDALIESIEATEMAGPVPRGFHIAQK